MTRVYIQYVGGSGLSARYIGTAEEPPDIVANHLRTVKNISYVSIYGDEVVAFGQYPF